MSRKGSRNLLHTETLIVMPSTFQEGQRCRVSRDYAYLNHAFRAGDEVIFTTCAYSAKEGLTRYWFRNVVSEEINAYHAFDDHNSEAELHKTFEAINAA